MIKRVTLHILLSTVIAFSGSAAEPERTFHNKITSLRDTTLMFRDSDGPVASKAVEIRASVVKPAAKADSDSNGFAVVWDTGAGSEMEAWLIPAADDFDPLSRKNEAEVIILRRIAGRPDSIFCNKTLSGNIAPGSGFNTLGVEIDASGAATVYAGEKEPTDVFTLPASGSVCRSTGVRARGEVKVDLLVTETVRDQAALLNSGLTIKDIESRLTGHSLLPPEGLWTYLDRDTDERALRLGGNYTLAIIADNPDSAGDVGSYTIVYLSGARVESSGWTSGMKKGRLTATLFQNHYNLKWISADMNEIDAECNAQLNDDKSIISFNFPLYGSTVRFARQLSAGALPAK